jgi:Fe-S cluster assembly protein SufD
MSTILPIPPTSADDPGWLQEHRAQAASRLEGAELPTADAEEWRYSSIGSFDPRRFDALIESRPDAQRPAGLSAVLRSLPPHAGGMVLVDGVPVLTHLDEAVAAKGVQLGPLSQVSDGAALLGEDPAPDVFATAVEAGATHPVAIRVPAGVTVEQPLVVVHWAEEPGTTAYGRVIVDVGADAEATVLEVEASADIEAFRSMLVDLRVAAAGRLRYLNVQQLGTRMWRVATHRTDVADQATVQAMQVAVGGRYARSRTDCRMRGAGGTGDLLALYFGTGDQVLDFRTFQRHDAPDTTSNLLFKGAVGDRSHSVYTGLITVAPGARGTNAFQTNRNLKLSDEAWADSVPNLEIENNDVRCSHASTVGPIDADQRFYLESRGVPPAVADRLIAIGFFDEVLDLLPVPELREALRAELVRRYDAVDHSGADAASVPAVGVPS